MAIVRPQKVKVRWNGKNRSHYESLGYIYTKQNDEFEVDVGELPRSSHKKIKIKCDQCKKIVKRKLNSIRNLEVNFCSRECVDIYKKGRGGRRKKERVKINCAYCNKETEKLESYLKKVKNAFCSKKCADSFMRGKENKKIQKRVKVKCYICGKEFELKKYRTKYSKRHFCSIKCRSYWMRSDEYSNIIKRDGTVNVKCDNKECNKEFKRRKSEFKKSKFHFCSIECKNKSINLFNHFIKNNPNPRKEKVNVECNQCGKNLKVHESKKKNNKYHFCSRKCYSDWRIDNTQGKDNPNYKRIRSNCDNCNKNIEVIPYYAKDDSKNNFCSQSCYWEFRSKYYIGEKHPQFGLKKSREQVEKMRIITTKRLSQGDLSRNTSIQAMINQLLDSMNIKYENEFNCKYYSVDNYLPDYNLMIEVMGDYWHSSPIKYNTYNNLNETQIKGIKRDKSKKTYIKKYFNIDMLYLWEYDIKNDIELCKQLIEHYIENKGFIDDYNSFNYELVNGKLKLKKTIISPYFSRKKPS